MISLQFNNTITERDMDLLFAESVMTDPGFCSLLINKTDLEGKPFEVSGVELSKTDGDLGESDITVVIDVEGDKHGFLIEDKIDAIAMPDQHGRYVKRGKKGVKAGEYKDFRVFIFCPEKYYRNNDEAKLYEHILTYEECKAYFDSKTDPLSAFRSRQFEEAITKAKKPPVINVDEKANAFLRQYIRYQKEHYPSLDLSTKEDKNGWWMVCPPRVFVSAEAAPARSASSESQRAKTKSRPRPNHVIHRMALCVVREKRSRDLNGQTASVTEGVSSIRWMLEKRAEGGRVRPYCPDRGGISAAEIKSLLLRHKYRLLHRRSLYFLE